MIEFYVNGRSTTIVSLVNKFGSEKIKEIISRMGILACDNKRRYCIVDIVQDDGKYSIEIVID